MPVLEWAPAPLQKEGWHTVIAAPLRASVGIAKWQYNSRNR